MNKYFNKISMCLCMGALVLGAASCSEPDDVITSVQYDRLFSPTEVGARVRNRTAVEVSWQTRNAKVDQYTVEISTDEAFGSIAKSVTAVASPVTIAGLDGETDYFVRVKASAEGIPESKWSPSAKFTTDTENIYLPQEDGDVTSSSVILRWTPGETVESIEVLDKSGATVKSQSVSAAESAEGVAKVDGLTKDTEYTFALKRNGKTRGKVTIATLPDYIPVYAGVNVDLQAVIDEAEAGKTIMLLPAKDGSTSEFTFASESGDASTKELTISKNVAISCLSTKPVSANIKFVLAGADGFSVSNLKLVGKSSDLFIKVSSASGTIAVEAVEAIGYKNFLNDPGENDCTVDELMVKNSYFHDFTGGRFIDFQKKKVGITVVNFKQNTIANSCKGQDLFRFDYAAGKMPTINFENNTIYKVDATSKGIMYVRSNKAGDKAFQANIKNNVFAECAEGTFFSQDSKTDGIEYSGNYYWNAPSLLVPKADGLTYDNTPKATNLDPKFKNAAKGDFSITNDDIIDAGNTEFAKFWVK